MAYVRVTRIWCCFNGREHKIFIWYVRKNKEHLINGNNAWIILLTMNNTWLPESADISNNTSDKKHKLIFKFFHRDFSHIVQSQLMECSLNYCNKIKIFYDFNTFGQFSSLQDKIICLEHQTFMIARPLS